MITKLVVTAMLKGTYKYKQNFWVQLVFIILIAMSCKNRLEKKPENLVPKEKLIQILADIHRLEGHVNNMNIQNTDTLAFIYRKMEADIFKKHKVDTASYFKSYKYYLVDPEEFSELYSEVVTLIKTKNKIDSTTEAKTKKFESDTSKFSKITQKKDRILKLKNAKFDSIKALYRHQQIK